MRYLHIAILLTACVLLCSINHMNIVWQQQGEQPSDDYGYYVIALDFNGDGIDDLAVSAKRYHLDENYNLLKGKLYIYYGSDEGLSESPDVTASVQVDTNYVNIISWFKLQNLGDMNGDGCDDIGYNYELVTYDGDYHPYRYINILLGNAVNDTIPVYSFEIDNSDREINPLGDINGDGYDDAGITVDHCDTLSYSIVYGGSFERVPFVDSLYTRNGKGFRGLGDVNGDGYDDFNYYYELDWDGTYYRHYNCFFYGGLTQTTTPDYTLEFLAIPNLWYELWPAGDWNGDGYDDFVISGYDVDEESMTAIGCPLWRGGETIHWDWYGYIEYYSDLMPSFGDLNGDGKGDIIKPYHYPASGAGGYLYFYLGNQNGTWDYDRGNGQDGFGTSRSHAVGDFDNDGFDDIAVGAYGDGGTAYWNWGHVFVYGGHQNLEETDLDPVDNETVPPSDITFNAYPNPFNPEISFEMKSNKKFNDLRIDIFNVKGQKVETIAVEHAGETVTWKPQNKASGVYFCKLSAEGKQLSVRKVTLLK